MRVILKKDIDRTGKAGELLEVSDGYARNFLFPKGLAEEATAGKVAELQALRRNKKIKEDKEKSSAEENKKRLQGKVIHVSASAGENGKLFGSVTAAQIAEALEDQHGISAYKRGIKLVEPVKQAGKHSVSVRLYAGVQVDMVLSVEIQNS
jgi:large subunit ribosomal protein L9